MIPLVENSMAVWVIFTGSSPRRSAMRTMDRARAAIENRLAFVDGEKRHELEFLVKRLSRGN